jgi:Domain of unknown function (DUF6484)
MSDSDAAASSTQDEAEAPAASADENAARPEAEEDLIEMVLAEHTETAEPSATAPAQRLTGIVIGVLTALGAQREPLVDFPANGRFGPLPARSTTAVAEADVGRGVALMFEDGDPTKPILLGLIHDPMPLPAEGDVAASVESKAMEVEADGQKVVVSAERELVLRCGGASITLTRAGKILIRGAYVLTRSSGVNRIQGGSVEIN